jgi:signal transduction histidine kinase
VTVERQHDPREHLLRTTGRRFAIFTLLLVTALVALVGVSTAFVATGLMRENIDRTLRAAVTDELLLHELAEDEDEYQLAPLGSADTFVLLVDEAGAARRNPSDIRLEGLPDGDAIAAAGDREDIRDGRYGGVDIRLLTKRITGLGEFGVPGDEAAYLQVGFVLTLQNAQQHELVMAVLGVALLGLLGAAVVTLLVTRRALVPIRSAFATERRFVAAASHELRTPVAVIRSSADIMEREGLVSDAGRSLVDDILGESDRLGRLVGDLLALASTETGAIAVERRPLDLGGWFDGVTRRATTLARAQSVRLDVRPPPDAEPMVVLADAERLEQLLQILIHNALEHSPPDGVVTLGLDLIEAKRVARLSVSDQGPGIPAAERARVFEPFARLRGERRSEAGTGLGLAIARQLAGSHDAELGIADRDHGPGTTFVLELPLAPAGTTTESGESTLAGDRPTEDAHGPER